MISESEVSAAYHGLNTKQHKRLKSEVVERLRAKLAAEQGESPLFADLQRVLDLVEEAKTGKRKAYNEALKILQGNARASYGYIERGSLKSQYSGLWMAYAIAFGTAFGTVFATMIENYAFLGSFSGAGVAIGLGLGNAYGGRKEAEAEEQNLLY